MTAISAIAGLVGAGLSAIGTINAGNQEAAADQTNAEIARQNAQIATADANSQAAIDKQQTEKQLGVIASQAGASGIVAGVGSPLDVMADQAATGELARQLDLYRGVVQASGNLTQANLLQQQATAAQEGALYRAGGTILTGAAASAKSAATLFDTTTPTTAAAPTIPTLPTNPLNF